jgi:hypothetical protein
MIARRWTFATDQAGEMALGAPGIVGKTIAHLVVKRRARGQPGNQLFLVFTDGTYYEFFTFQGELTGASAIDRGGLAEVQGYQGLEGIVLQASAPETADGEPVPWRDVHGRAQPDLAQPEDEVWEEAILRGLENYRRERGDPPPPAEPGP